MKQFTDRFGKGGEVMFDRICRKNGVKHRLGPVELDQVVPASGNMSMAAASFGWDLPEPG